LEENRKLNCKLEENKELKLIILLKRHGLVMRKAKPTKPTLIICFRKMKSVQEATFDK
jgi:hypothetical protein